jgi:membrane fusion protein (multidrug efflux system)
MVTSSLNVGLFYLNITEISGIRKQEKSINMKMLSRKINLVIAAAIVILAVSCTEKEDKSSTKSDRVNVRATTLKKQDITIEKNFYGNVKFKQSMIVVAEMQGRVGKLIAETGKKVKKGEVLLSYPSQNHHLQIQQTELAYTELKAEYERQLILFKEGAVSKVTLDRLKNQLDIQKRAYMLSEQMYTIKAPFTGVITDVMVNIGQEISPEQQLFAIAKTDEIEVDFFVTDKDINDIEEGSALRIFAESDTLTGKVTQKAIIMDAEKKAFRVKGSFKFNYNLPIVGKTVKIGVITEHIANAIIIPQESIKESNNSVYVYINKNKHAEKRFINKGRTIGLDVLVTSGLNPGESLITTGIGKLDKQPNINIIN